MERAIVRYAPNWCEEGESRYLFVVLEDWGSRVLMRCINSKMTIPPTEIVEKYMVEEVGRC